MNTNKSIVSDFISLLFSPKRFFEERFMALSSRRIMVLGFMGTLVGMGLGSLVTAFFSHAVAKDFALNQELYGNVIKTLGLTETAFLEVIQAQKAYSLLVAGLSPIIAYMAPHIFGGAVYLFMWLLIRPTDDKINFHRVMECTAISLTSLAFYLIPAIGPVIAMVMVALNLSRALLAQYKMAGFMKIMSILSAMYICFFLAGTTLQMLAKPFSTLLPG